ncbi:MAG TPA: cell wall hydrolase [Phenylobacterium sp.]|jgi:spore germination cell wall hydrolase CwlJ-like protein|nr:cell wall hydrolase [Phenylobacterium sp.]
MRDDAIHLAGAQLALVVLMSAGLALAAVPARHAPRLMTARLTPSAAAAQLQPAATASATPEEPAVIRLQDLAPDQARLWNANNPISKAPNPAAKPFKLDAEGVLDEARAVDCMTAAIYYEAGFESTEGQRAVAQVVLNRMRHPAFPKTVCGVVFQGAERPTGCQFTFTCDGALARKPDEDAWARARKVAEAALNGYVMKQVGEATHYHANYVAPYWSPNLVKVAVVGQHIFYRWTGGWGTPPAFVGRYAGGEMTGLKVATLDNLARSSARPGLAEATTALAEPAAPVADAPTVKVAVAARPAAELVTTASVAKDAGTITQPEDLDWNGEPKVKKPHLAIPGGPRLPGLPH